MAISLVAAAACGVDSTSVVETPPGEDALAEGGELSATSRTYVGIRRDFRRCIAPLCGGYWVHDLNRAHFSEQYVSGLDFVGSGLSAEDQARVEAAPTEVVLRGKLGPKEPQFNTRPFVVSEAYRGLPGKTVSPAERFYKLEDAQLVCARAPCPSLAARRLNYTAQTLLHELRLQRAASGLVQRDWLEKRAIADGAITAGRFVRDGEALALDASQVFLRLPEHAGPCPLFRLAQCPDGQVHSFTRTPDRCVVPQGCITPGVCRQYLPSCADGYTLASWRSRPHACPAFACDPSWVVQ